MKVFCTAGSVQRHLSVQMWLLNVCVNTCYSLFNLYFLTTNRIMGRVIWEHLNISLNHSIGSTQYFILKLSNRNHVGKKRRAIQWNCFFYRGQKCFSLTVVLVLLSHHCSFFSFLFKILFKYAVLTAPPLPRISNLFCNSALAKKKKLKRVWCGCLWNI